MSQSPLCSCRSCELLREMGRRDPLWGKSDLGSSRHQYVFWGATERKGGSSGGDTGQCDYFQTVFPEPEGDQEDSGAALGGHAGRGGPGLGRPITVYFTPGAPTYDVMGPRACGSGRRGPSSMAARPRPEADAGRRCVCGRVSLGAGALLHVGSSRGPVGRGARPPCRPQARFSHSTAAVSGKNADRVLWAPRILHSEGMQSPQEPPPAPRSPSPHPG